MHRLERRLGHAVHTGTGLVWRDSPAPLQQITAAVVAEGVTHTEVPADSVGEFFPGLEPDRRDALWFPEAGALLAADAVAGYRQLFDDGGGTLLLGSEVTSVRTTSNGAAVTLDDGRRLDADRAVVCAGPGTPELLHDIGLHVPLRPFLEQVVHLGRRAEPHLADHLPCLFDGPGGHELGIYSMPTPGVGYKIGFDSPLRELVAGDLDRVPDPDLTAAIVKRADRILPWPDSEVIDEHVCCWTDSPDGWFAIDTVGSVVVACGDAGKGFKYSPAIGEILADLAEGEPADPDVAAMSARRFDGISLDSNWSPTSLGGARA